MNKCGICKHCNNYFGTCNLQDFQHCAADCSSWDEVYENCPLSFRLSDGRDVNDMDKDAQLQLLGRLEADCKSFIAGELSEDHLWAKSIEDQIRAMRALYFLNVNTTSLSLENIDKYEFQMKNCKKIGSGTLDALAIALMNGATYERSGFGGDSELQLDAEATARNLRRGGWLHVSEVLEILKEVEAILPTHWSLPEEFNGHRQKLEMIKQEVLTQYGVKE